ncbi:MAG: hypothetical protein ACR2P4_10050, partial [Gammaproteobacteria bacterium]
PLDAAAAFHIIGLDRAPVAAAIREAGGVCMLAAHIGNPAAEPVCGTPQNSPNIALPNNANKTFIIRNPDINTPGVIGILSTPPRR